MNGLTGAITETSKQYNELAINDTIRGIRTARNMHEKIREAEIAKRMVVDEKEVKEEVNPNLLAEIQAEMEL